MQELDDTHWEQLRHFNQLVSVADDELADTFDTGRMSDSKSAVFAVMNAADALTLPEEIAAQLRAMAHDSWQGALSSGGDVYARAGNAIAAIGRIQSFLGALCAAHGRTL